jgi:hypothetical protein
VDIGKQRSRQTARSTGLSRQGIALKALNPSRQRCSKGHKEIAKLLRKHGGKTSEELKAEGK